MDKTDKILNDIIELMKQKYGAVVTEVKGFNFSAVDIGINIDEKPDIYRITILRHNQHNANKKS